jgi:hypothetical protein
MPDCIHNNETKQQRPHGVQFLHPWAQTTGILDLAYAIILQSAVSSAAQIIAFLLPLSNSSELSSATYRILLTILDLVTKLIDEIENEYCLNATIVAQLRMAGGVHRNKNEGRAIKSE